MFAKKLIVLVRLRMRVMVRVTDRVRNIASTFLLCLRIGTREISEGDNVGGECSASVRL